MARNSTFKRHDKPTRTHAAFNSTPCLAIMDRTGRIHTVPWLRTTPWVDPKPTLQMLLEKLTWNKPSARSKPLSIVKLASLRAWYARVVRRAQLWWQA